MDGQQLTTRREDVLKLYGLRRVALAEELGRLYGNGEA